MCGRFFVSKQQLMKAKQLAEQLKKKQLQDFKTEEVFPGDHCLVLIRKAEGVELAVKKWGIRKHGLLINARKETVKTKPTFRNLRRCAVIINGFFEWKDKEKYYIASKDTFTYLQALYDENDELVILTQAAEGEMKTIHERMPLLMNKKELLEYLQLKDLSLSNKELLIEKQENQTKLF